MAVEETFEKKIFSRDASLFLIEAVDKDGNKAVFQRSSICHLRAAGQEGSQIILKSGLQISLPVSCDELKQTIYFTPSAYDGGVLDLSQLAVTQTISPSFAKAAVKKEAQAESEPGALIIASQFRIPETKEYIEMEISKDSFDLDLCMETRSMVTLEPGIKIHFKPGFFPQGHRELVLDISKQMFADMLDEAIQKKMTRLEIRTRPPIAITLNVRKSRQEVHLPFTFTDDQINWPVGLERIGKHNSLTRTEGFKFYLKTSKSPFNDSEVIVDMPLSQFMAAYSKAKETGSRTLDLTKKTTGQKRWFGR